MTTDSHDDNESLDYQFEDVDRAVVAIAVQLITKIARSDLLSESQRSVVNAIIGILGKLPRTSDPLYASFTLTGPRRTFGKHEIYHYWVVEVEDQQIEVSARGHFYRPSTGGDSFTSFRWVACPGFEPECQDFAASIQIVDDAKPFGTEIEDLDLTEPGYSISVTYDGEDVCDTADEEDEEEESNQINEDDHSTPELTACLWAFLDADTGVIYALAGRAYSLSGSDEVKLQILRGLSRHDYRSATRTKVPERFSIQYGDGSSRKGVTLVAAVNDPSSMLFGHLFAEMEKSLPTLPDLANDRPLVQKFSNDPLCIRTIVYEDAAGHCRANR